MGRSGLRLLGLGLLLLGGLSGALFATGSQAAVPVTTTASTAKSVLVLTGHGWGHGLGMSQWGAYGYAKHGWTYDRILGHYYVGTTLGPAKVTTVRVLLASEKQTTLGATAPWSVTDGAGTTVQLSAATPVVLAPDLAVNGQVLSPPLAFRSAQPLVVDQKPYRGRIVVTSDGKAVQAVDVVGLESYVKGVVGPEMPAGWPAEALKAQAVASRSYALANLAHARGFDLYSDSRSQDYGGVAVETPATSAAVDATRRQVVLYNGKVADTLFSASSGGRTASAAETTGLAVPYLVSVADPYDTASPYHDWGPVLFDLAKVAKALKLTEAIQDMQVTTGTSGRAKTVSVVTDAESQVNVTGNQLRAALGLRSTWFTPAVLQLLPPAKAMTYGGAASLTGFARGPVDAVSLESRTVGGAWTPAGDLSVGPGGAFSTIVSPQLSTQYRLVWGNVRVGLAKVGVAPLVDVQQTAQGLQGTMQPAVAGAGVDLEQQVGTTWTTLSSTVSDANGAWSFSGHLAPGAYRVRCAPGHGLVAGVSGALQVQ